MVSELFCSQLVLIALLWLCLALHAEWKQLRTHASAFREIVERDRVTVP